MTTEEAKPKEEQKVKVEDVNDSSSSDDEAPGTEVTTQGGAQPETEKASKQSRTKKKSRKAIQKLGMKPVSGVVRVTVKKAKNVSNRNSNKARLIAVH